jgi:hypothetical protein
MLKHYSIRKPVKAKKGEKCELKHLFLRTASIKTKVRSL